MTPVGILGVGVFLPAEIRRNDWWNPALVEKWRKKMAENLVRPRHDPDDPVSEGVRRVVEAMGEFADDPFKGAVERRVMPHGMVSSDMEVAAAEDAIARSGTDRSMIDLLLVHSQLPDYLNVPTAPRVHRRLGLAERCLSMSTEGACNSFLMQLALAEQMVRGGRARQALLIQSSAVSRVQRPEDHHSVWFGDAATAVLVGPVREGHGILGQTHRTDGSLYEAMVTGCPGGRWYDGGKIVGYVANSKSARRMLLLIADLARQSVHEALAEAGCSPESVDFYATHQSTRWFRRVTQEHIGLTRARHADTFSWTAGLGSANIPFMLAVGEREHLLKEGNLVAMHTGGSGITWSAVVLRWGGG